MATELNAFSPISGSVAISCPIVVTRVSSVTLPVLLPVIMVGSSTAVTEVVRVTALELLLMLLMPPLLAPLTLTLSPEIRRSVVAVPDSTKRADRVPGVPLKLAAGRKRTRVSPLRKRATLVEIPLIAFQSLSSYHCHSPWLELAEVAVIATPKRVLAAEPLLVVCASLTSLKAVAKRLLTVAPAGLRVSSAIDVRLTLEAVRVGASLIGAIVKLRLAATMAP